MFERLQRGIVELMWRVTSGVSRRTHTEELIKGISVRYEKAPMRQLTGDALDLLDEPSLALVRRNIRRIDEISWPEVLVSHRAGLLALSSREWNGDPRMWAVGFVWMAAVAREASRHSGNTYSNRVYRWAMRAAVNLQLSESDQNPMAKFIGRLSRGQWSTLKVEAVN